MSKKGSTRPSALGLVDLFLTFFIDCVHIYVPKGVFWGSTSRPHIGDMVMSLFFTLGVHRSWLSSLLMEHFQFDWTILLTSSHGFHRPVQHMKFNKSKVGRHHPKGGKQVNGQKQRDGEQYTELNDDKIMIWSEWSDEAQTALSYMNILFSDGHVYKRIAWRLCLRKWFLSPDLWFEAMTATAVSCDLPYLEQRQAETTGLSGPWLWLLSPPSSPSPPFSPFPPPPPSSSDNSIVNILPCWIIH